MLMHLGFPEKYLNFEHVLEVILNTIYILAYLTVFGCSGHRRSILMRQIRILMKQFRTGAGIEPRIIVLALAVRTIQIIVIIGKDI